MEKSRILWQKLLKWYLKDVADRIVAVYNGDYFIKYNKKDDTIAFFEL